MEGEEECPAKIGEIFGFSENSWKFHDFAQLFVYLLNINLITTNLISIIIIIIKVNYYGSAKELVKG